MICMIHYAEYIEDTLKRVVRFCLRRIVALVCGIVFMNFMALFMLGRWIIIDIRTEKQVIIKISGDAQSTLHVSCFAK